MTIGRRKCIYKIKSTLSNLPESLKPKKLVPQIFSYANLNVEKEEKKKDFHSVSIQQTLQAEIQEADTVRTLTFYQHFGSNVPGSLGCSSHHGRRQLTGREKFSFTLPGSSG